MAGVTDGISVERDDGGIATVWLDRPERGNGFIAAMQTELHRRIEELDADDDVRVIVVTGRGKLFSVGADMEPGGTNFAFDDDQHAAARNEMSQRVRPWELRTPIIGALNGSAVGLGLTFAMQWDIRVVNEAAKYGFVFTRRGLTPEQNSMWLVPRLIGTGAALELLLTGRTFSGTEARQIGLATHAVPGVDVLTTAYRIADEIIANTSPTAVGVTKQFVYQALQDPDRESSFHREWEIFRWAGRRDDAAEGVASFIDRRRPEFPGGKHDPLPDFIRSWGGSDD